MKRSCTNKTTLFVIMIIFVMILSACSSSGTSHKSGTENTNGQNSKYNILQPFDEGGLIIVRDNDTGLTGAIDGKGEFVVPCEYSAVEYQNGNLYILEKDGMYGLTDGEGNAMLQCGFLSIEMPEYNDWDEKYMDDLIIAQDSNGNFGYYSIEDGSEVIKPQFEAAESFWSGDRAMVKTDGAWGIIDRSGKMIVPAIFRFEEDTPIEWRGTSIVLIRDENWKRELINTDGKIIIAPGIISEDSDWSIEPTSSEDLSIVYAEGQYSVMDKDGRYVIPPGDEPIRNEGHLFLVGEHPQIFNEKGEKILNDKYIIDEDCDISVTEPYTGFLVVRDRNTQKTGLLDEYGNEVIPCEYEGLENEYFNEKSGKGLWMTIDSNRKCGLVNEKGEEVMPPKYDDISSFRNGCALVMNDGKVGSIDMEGKELSLCKYTAYNYESGFSYFRENADIPECMVPVMDEKNSRIALMNSRGDLITDFKYDSAGVTARSGSAGYTKSCMIVKSGDDKYGIVDENGREICPCNLSDVIGEAGNGLLLVRKKDGDFLSLVDLDGNTVYEGLFSTI